jgi:hypothetical protein
VLRCQAAKPPFAVTAAAAADACRTVTDVQISMLGLVIAVIAVLSSALQQIMCGAMQRKHLVSSHQLLSNTAHIQVCKAFQRQQPQGRRALQVYRRGHKAAPSL